MTKNSYHITSGKRKVEEFITLLKTMSESEKQQIKGVMVGQCHLVRGVSS